MGRFDKPNNDLEKSFNASLISQPFNIDYNNTGWEEIHIKEKLPELMRAAELNSEISNYTELGGGYFNKIILVETALEKVVAKISPLWNSGNLTRENFVYSNLIIRSGGLFKIARVYSHISDDNTIIPNHEVLILEYIDGVKPTDEELTSGKLHKAVASFFASIHNIPMQGYGWLDKKLLGKNNSWHTFLSNIDNLDATINSKLLPGNNIGWLINELLSECNEDFDPILLYGDLKPENILIKNGSIYLIDFENCFSGHKLYDIGIALFFIPQIWENLDIYLEKTNRKKSEKQILLYAMRHAISCLGHRVTTGDTNESAIATKRFFELKKLYECK